MNTYRTIGEKSPTVRYSDFENIDNNSFIAVSQFKIRILGTEVLISNRRYNNEKEI